MVRSVSPDSSERSSITVLLIITFTSHVYGDEIPRDRVIATCL